MTKKNMILVIGLIMLGIFVYGVTSIHSTYTLGEVEVDGWHFQGGSIKLNGLTREFEYEGLDYTLSDGKEATEIGLTILSHSKFINFSDELANSSVGEEQPFLLDSEFEYGGGSGRTHSTQVYKSYLIDSVKVQIEIINEDVIERVVMQVPVSYGK